MRRGPGRVTPVQRTFLLARGVAAVRRDRLLFRNLDIDLMPGDAIRLEGANGSGKSTLLRILSGLLPPYAGTIDRSGSIGWVGHDNGFSTDHTLRQELTFWLGQVPGPDRPDFGLRPLLDVRLGTLSQGQKRRAALWRLVGQRTAIWLLDEPGVGLDAGSLASFSAAIAEFRQAGGMVVMATHGETILNDAQILRLGDAA
ncbi:ABC transporter ATP-binding protein [Pacificimonas sp. ICDLI1SI03]